MTVVALVAPLPTSVVVVLRQDRMGALRAEWFRRAAQRARQHQPLPSNTHDPATVPQRAGQGGADEKRERGH